MKIFIETHKNIQKINALFFLVSSYLGTLAAIRVGDSRSLDTIFLSIHFVWLALFVIFIFSLSAFTLYKIYSKYNLLIATEANKISTITKGFFTFIGLGSLAGFIGLFAIRSFLLMALWLFSNI